MKNITNKEMEEDGELPKDENGVNLY